MRKCWLDELPMLYNWLREELQIVGVRPLSMHYLSLKYFDNGSVQVDIYINDFLLESLLLNQEQMVHKYYYIQ